jgi:hypothetical protein
MRPSGLSTERRNGGRDSNHRRYDSEINRVNACGIVKKPVGCVALDDRVANPGELTRTPFGIPADGRFFETSGEGGMAVELFLAGVRRWDTRFQRSIDAPARR